MKFEKTLKNKIRTCGYASLTLDEIADSLGLSILCDSNNSLYDTVKKYECDANDKDILIGLIIELVKRLGALKYEGGSITSPREIYDYCSSMRYLSQEYFKVLFLDIHNRIIGARVLTIGTECSSLVSVRETLTCIIKNGISRVVFVHNHPSGNSAPSVEDIQVTRSLKNGCEAIGVQMLDHLIVGDDEYYSFKEMDCM